MDLSDKLRRLYEVEQEGRVQPTPKVEQSTGSFEDHANYSRAFKGPSRESGSTRIGCHLYGQKHFMSRYPDLGLAQALVKRYCEYRAGIKYNRKNRSE
ncbi:hypothetical protein K3495_g1339 [Podosphaera aphanis]|nr:hypothetical protein K3495_g1339 [Podosphaera aphanis]